MLLDVQFYITTDMPKEYTCQNYTEPTTRKSSLVFSCYNESFPEQCWAPNFKASPNFQTSRHPHFSWVVKAHPKHSIFDWEPPWPGAKRSPWSAQLHHVPLHGSSNRAWKITLRLPMANNQWLVGGESVGGWTCAINLPTTIPFQKRFKVGETQPSASEPSTEAIGNHHVFSDLYWESIGTFDS